MEVIVFTINEPLYLWIPSQVLATISIVFIIWSFWLKDKAKFLIFQSLALLMFIGSLALLQNWVFMGILSVALVRNVCYFALERKGLLRKWQGLATMIFFVLATTAVVVTIAVVIGHRWVDWPLLVTGVGFVVAVYMKNSHPVRIMALLQAPFLFYNHVYFQNIVGIILESIIVISVFVFYAKSFAQAKARKNLVDDTVLGVAATDLPEVVPGLGDVNGDKVELGDVRGQ